MLYLISYDLIGEHKDYEAVEQVIRAASKGKYVRCLKSTWLLRSEIESIYEVKDLLESFMDSDDQFLVTEITGKLRGRLPQRVWAAWDSING